MERRNLEFQGDWVVELSSLFQGQINDKVQKLRDSLINYNTAPSDKKRIDRKLLIRQYLDEAMEAAIEIKRNENL